MRIRVLLNRSLKGAPASFALLLVALFALISPAGSTNASQPFAYPGAAFSLQQEDGWATLKRTDGLLFVWNLTDLHFSLVIKGTDIKPLDDPDHIFFTVDGRVLQIHAAPIKDFAPDAKERKLDDRAILAAHRDWESKFIEELLHSKLRVQTFNVKLSNGGDASLWQFDMPEGMNADAHKQLYLTVVRGDFVVLVNSEVTSANPEEEGRKFLLEMMATLKTSATPIDVKALAESKQKGVGP
jgi:uncharacterized membrane protein (UPF0127 family)